MTKNKIRDKILSHVNNFDLKGLLENDKEFADFHDESPENAKVVYEAAVEVEKYINKLRLWLND